MAVCLAIQIVHPDMAYKLPSHFFKFCRGDLAFPGHSPYCEPIGTNDATYCPNLRGSQLPTKRRKERTSFPAHHRYSDRNCLFKQFKNVANNFALNWLQYQVTAWMNLPYSNVVVFPCFPVMFFIFQPPSNSLAMQTKILHLL